MKERCINMGIARQLLSEPWPVCGLGSRSSHRRWASHNDATKDKHKFQQEQADVVQISDGDRASIGSEARWSVNSSHARKPDVL